MKSANDLLHYLRKTGPGPSSDAATDGHLLERFIERRDGDAFGALLRRHGPMVWALCLRVLHNRQDAEDAFQATFLVLVRKADTIEPRGKVGNWLYGVAYRAARKAVTERA